MMEFEEGGLSGIAKAERKKGKIAKAERKKGKIQRK